MAEHTNTSKNTIQAKKKKKMMPNLKTVEKLLDELGYKLTIEKVEV